MAGGRGKWKYTIVTHTDLDGVASAAVYLRLGGGVLGVDARLFFAEPYNLDRVLHGVDAGTERLAVMDLGINAPMLDRVVGEIERLTGAGVVVEWYDHHRWSDEWVKALSSAGADVVVDTSTCATGVVARYAPDRLGSSPDGFVEKLARSVCAADLWRWDDPWGPRLFRVVDRYTGRRGDEWKRSLVRGFAEGALWWPELDEALEGYLRLEFRGFHYALRHTVVRDYDGCRVAYVLKRPGPPSPSIVGNAVLGRTGADIAVVVRSRGRGMSLRSRGVDVQRIAVVLGGGGHPRAAGAPLEMGVVARLLSRLYPPLRLRYAEKAVSKAIAEAGCRRL